MSAEVSIQSACGVEPSKAAAMATINGKMSKLNTEEGELSTEELEEKFAALLDQDLVDAVMEEISAESSEPDEPVVDGQEQIIELKESTPKLTISAATAAVWPSAAEGESVEEKEQGKQLSVENIEPAEAELAGTEMELVEQAADGGDGAAENVTEIKQQDIKREAVGMDTMLDDLPDGWETLLDNEPGQAADQDGVEVKSDQNRVAQVGELKSDAVKAAGAATADMTAGEQSESDRETPKTVDMEFIKPVDQQSAKISGHEAFNIQDHAVDGPDLDMGIKTSSHEPLTRSSGSAHLLNHLNDVQRQGVIKSFTQETIKAVQSNDDVLNIELNPPELGHVQVAIHRSGDQIHAKLFMADSQLGEFFKEHLDQIKRTIESTGMKLGDFSLEVGQEKYSEQQEFVRQRQQNNQGQGGGGGSDAGIDVSSQTARGLNASRNRDLSAKVDMLI